MSDCKIDYTWASDKFDRLAQSYHCILAENSKVTVVPQDSTLENTVPTTISFDDKFDRVARSTTEIARGFVAYFQSKSTVAITPTLTEESKK